MASKGSGLSGGGFQFSQEARRTTVPVAPDSATDIPARPADDVADALEAPAPLGKNGSSALEAPLAHLIELERVVSRERQVLHRRIEFVRGTAAHEPDARELLSRLVAEERELSEKRRELHVTIDSRRGTRQQLPAQ